MLIQRFLRTACATAVLGLGATSAHASLTSFMTFTGNIGYSSDGAGFSTDTGSIQASVPVGATVVGAYLYSSTTTTGAVTGSLNGNSVNYVPLGVDNGFLQANRADVTSIVKAVVNSGPGGVYNFTVGEGNTSVQDGEALVVVYSLASLPTSTFAILDGFSASGGDSTAINFAKALDPTAPGFHAEMFIGDGFSYDADDNGTQTSTIKVDGTTITNSAGDYDDGAPANGALITVGGYDDPYSPFLPTISQDHERYNLASYGIIKAGDTTISVNTNNPSGDDNIFLAGFFVTGLAAINAPPPTTGVPEPETLALTGLGALGLALARRRKAAR